MWGTTVDSEKLRRAESHDRQPHQQHDRRPPGNIPEDRREDDSSDGVDLTREGTWGERNVEDVTRSEAMQEYENLRQNLTQLHKSRTAESQAGRSLTQTRSRRSHATSNRPESRAERRRTQETDLEAGDEEKDDTGDEADDFELSDFMREGHFEKRTTRDGSHKRVGVVFENLTVKGLGATASFVRTVPDAVIGTFGPDLYRLLSKHISFLRPKNQPTRTLINDFSGAVRDGEMMLVLGRPGSGCSTFLKAVSNNRDSFASVEGEVSYGGLPADKQKKFYRGEVVYNDEDDIHFATLSVWKTLVFALQNKSKKAVKGDVPVVANALMKMFGISHTKHTQVGDEYTRGVSGGERKRVSIAETLASKAAVIAWDNSTRGLDASTALDYARSLRIMTDVSNRTTLVTLYQAGEGIYELMDKVLVIDDGRQIYCGPANQAKQYFIDLGFECPERQTTADFLTAVTDPNERRFRPGFEKSAPKTAEELERAFRESSHFQANLDDVAAYKRTLADSDYANTKQFEGAVQEAKSKHVSEKSPFTVPFYRQVLACTKREAWLLFADKPTLWTKLFIIISNGLIVGSLFYGQPETTEGAFTRGGAVFFSILFLGTLSLSTTHQQVAVHILSTFPITISHTRG